MSRIRPDELPKPKKVSKKRANELLATFSVSGTSKYDMYVAAALDLNPGESLDVIVLPENVITSIQKKFREQGLTRAKGYFVMSKALGNEKAGQKSLLIGRYAKIPKATTRTSKKKTTARSTSKATTASRAKVAQKRTAATSKTATKATSSSGRTAKPRKTTTSKKTTTPKRATTATKATAKRTTAAKKTTGKRTTAAKRTTKAENTNGVAVAA